jgi:type 1 glutamine amidotransferase
MALTYIPAYKGYIADVPRVWFKRCSDGRVFYFDEITQA